MDFEPYLDFAEDELKTNQALVAEHEEKIEEYEKSTYDLEEETGSLRTSVKKAKTHVANANKIFEGIKEIQSWDKADQDFLVTLLNLTDHKERSFLMIVIPNAARIHKHKDFAKLRDDPDNYVHARRKAADRMISKISRKGRLKWLQALEE
jgi:hypothetical protein